MLDYKKNDASHAFYKCRSKRQAVADCSLSLACFIFLCFPGRPLKSQYDPRIYTNRQEATRKEDGPLELFRFLLCDFVDRTLKH
jgi:hypothetical protein